MQFSVNKSKISAISVMILMVTSITLLAMPIRAQEEAHGSAPELTGGSVPLPAGVTPGLTFSTIAYMSFTPNPIGVGQTLLVNVWIEPPIFQAHYLNGYTITFTKPDGTKDVITSNSYYGDATAWFNYVPNQVGTWKIKFDFPGGYFPPGNYTSILTYTLNQTINSQQGIYYKPSSDGPYDLVVQTAQVASWPTSPLPTDYWTRPVSPQNREWWPILGNYPATGIVGGGSNWPADTNTYMSNYLFTPYVQAPNTAHVLWRRQGAIGGLLGGTAGQWSYTSGGGNPNIIYAGRCYQTVTKMVNNVPTSVWECYDLQTGQVYWDQAGITQVPTMLSYASGNVANIPFEVARDAGLTAQLLYVGGGRAIAYNPWTGTVNYNVSIAPLTTGTFYADPFFLSVQTIGTGSNTQYRLINWTVVRSIWDYITPSASIGAVIPPPAMNVFTNISWPFSSLGTVDYESMIAVTTLGITPASVGVAYSQMIMGVSLTTGQLLFNVTTDPISGTQGSFSGSTAVADHGKFAMRLNDGHWHCWDLHTGNELWVSELSSWPWGTFGCYGVQSYGGMILSNQYDGVAAYNWTNGKLVWLYQAPAPYSFETPYQNDYPWFTGVSVIADGKLYAYNTEHTPSEPFTRGWELHCINITTGEGIWNITGSMSPGAVSDGYLTASNGYDGYMYVFGRGQSATTVSASQTAIAAGQNIEISGTVIDQSPGDLGSITNPTARTDFPKTVPCVSKGSLKTQMDHLYWQEPIDGISHNETMTGVPVTLTTIDAQGKVINIGTTTTNPYYGTFSMTWTPQSAGNYTITASFAADDSYGSSSAATTIAVGAATPSPSTGPIQASAPDYNMTIIGTGIAVIIAVAIVGLLILRKRP